MLDDFPDRAALAREVLMCEQEGDRITHDLILLVSERSGSASGVIDRSEVHTLATTLDDVVDFTEEAADALVLYGVEAPMVQAQELADVLLAATAQLVRALEDLGQERDAAAALIEIHRLENEADTLVRRAVGSLFATGVDPMQVIRWKSIFELLEQAVDGCEKVAHLLEGLALRRRGRH